MSTCFGFFLGDATCEGCAVKKRCRSVLLSSGIDTLASTLDVIIAEMQEADYTRTERIPQILDQVLKPKEKVVPPPLTPEQKELLDAIEAGDRK